MCVFISSIKTCAYLTERLSSRKSTYKAKSFVRVYVIFIDWMKNGVTTAMENGWRIHTEWMEHH